MLFYVVIAVFIGGLMVGRTPEYLGKKIGAREVKFVGDRRARARSSWCSRLTGGRGGDPGRRSTRRLNHGPHGFSEILYAFLSKGNNNGSAFAGLTASGPFYAIGGGLADARRSGSCPLIAALALAGEPRPRRDGPGSRRARCTPTRRCSSCCSPCVILIIGALTFLPGLALGPIVEHLSNGRLI